MRFLLSLICCITVTISFGQTITIFYDSSWIKTTPDKAFYYVVHVKHGLTSESSTYWADSNKLYSKTTSDDTAIMKNAVELQFYKSGQPMDTVLYDESGNIKSYNRYRENGTQEFHAFYDEKEKYVKSQLYDEKGNKIPGFLTFQKQAMFPGGLEGWVTYLQTHLKADIPNRKKAPVGLYTVMVSFLVGKDGKISEVTAENDPGYGTAQEAVRVIQKGPDWIPAEQNNKKVIYRQRQPITFQVEEAHR